MLNGTVKWFNATKGYGFISVEGDNEYFVHYSGIVSDGFKTLEDGAKVQFDVIEKTENGKGPQAVNVVVISSPKAEEKKEETN